MDEGSESRQGREATVNLSAVWSKMGSVTKVALAGAVVLLLVFGLGVCECLQRTLLCSSDPCWALWVHCVWVTLTSPIVVALVAAGIAAGLAWWYQRANKIMEFQFNTFERAMRVYSDLSTAAWDRLTTFARLEILRQRGTPVAEPAIGMARDLRQEVEEKDRALHDAIMAGHTIIAVHSVLFPRHITDHWGRMMALFQMTTDDDLWAAEEAVYQAPEHRIDYMRGVAREMRLPFPEPQLTREAVEAHRVEFQELILRAQPRPTRPAGGN
jgi:hypothetical protein